MHKTDNTTGVTVPQAAAALGLSVPRLRRLMRTEGVRGVHRGRAVRGGGYRIDIPVFQAWMAASSSRDPAIVAAETRRETLLLVVDLLAADAAHMIKQDALGELAGLSPWLQRRVIGFVWARNAMLLREQAGGDLPPLKYPEVLRPFFER